MKPNNMEKQKNKKKKAIRLAVVMLLAGGIGISFGYSVGKYFKSTSRTLNQIEMALKENCNCDSVTFEFSAMGLQFSKEDGVNNKTVAFTLEGNKTADEKQEAIRLNTILADTVKNYAAIDLITLHFDTETIKIKNGVVQ